MYAWALNNLSYLGREEEEGKEEEEERGRRRKRRKRSRGRWRRGRWRRGERIKCLCTMYIFVCVFFYLSLSIFTGTTGERILVAGDSAGGYFSIVTAMKANQLKLRIPDQIFAYYPATLISSAVSPSRFLSLMDPLLPIGILLSCLQVSPQYLKVYCSPVSHL